MSGNWVSCGNPIFQGVELQGIEGEAAEREAHDLEKVQVIWDNIDGKGVVYWDICPI